MKYLFLILTFFIFSCAQKSVISSDQVFPWGVYKQDIHVKFTKEGKPEEAEFKAILKKTPTEINMYCYVGFGITLFKLKDNLKDPIEFIASEPRIEKNKDFFLKMYPIIKEILNLQKTDPRLKSARMTFYMPPEKFPVEVIMGSKKIGDLPAELTIENKPHFQFHITTREYDAL